MRASIIYAFREQVMMVPYEKITIAGICEVAHVARTVFYTYFENKDDLLKNVIIDDIIEPTRQMRKLMPTRVIESSRLLTFERIYLNVLEKREFYAKLSAGNSGLLYRIITGLFFQMNTDIVREFDQPQDEKHYIAYMMASAMAASIIYWIDNEFAIEPKLMAQFYLRHVAERSDIRKPLPYESEERGIDT